MTPENADNAGHATSSEERQYRHRNVQRSLCGETADAPGEGRTHGGRTCRKERNPNDNTLHVGKRESVPSERRSSNRCPSSQSEREDALAERVAFSERISECRSRSVGLCAIALILNSIGLIHTQFDRFFTSASLRYRREVGAGLFIYTILRVTRSSPVRSVSQTFHRPAGF